jgi:hypothetical protein
MEGWERDLKGRFQLDVFANSLVSLHSLVFLLLRGDRDRFFFFSQALDKGRVMEKIQDELIDEITLGTHLLQLRDGERDRAAKRSREKQKDREGGSREGDYLSWGQEKLAGLPLLGVGIIHDDRRMLLSSFEG